MNIKAYFGPKDFYKNAIVIAAPVIIQVVIQSLVSFIDNFMVANLGDLVLSGVNNVNQLLFVFLVIANSISSGSGIFMSQYNGGDDVQGMQNVLRFKLIFFTILPLILLFISLSFPRELLSVLVINNTDANEILDIAVVYFRIITIGFIPFGLTMALGSSFRDVGMTKPLMIGSVTAAILNTVLNYLLIYGNFGFPKLGYQGAAYATVIARLVEALIILGFYYFKKQRFFIKLRTYLNIHGHIARKILSKSYLIIFTEISWVVSEFIATAVYNSRGGKEVVAGMASGWVVLNLFMVVFPAITVPIGVMLGKKLGANKLEEAEAEARYFQGGAIILGLTFSFLAFFFGQTIVDLVFAGLSHESRFISGSLIRGVAFYFPLWTLLNAYFGISRSGGDVKLGFILDVAIQIPLFTGIILALAFFTDLGPVELYVYSCLNGIIKIIVAIKLLSKKKWVRNLNEKSEIPLEV